MRVEIELTEQEALELRAWRQGMGAQGGFMRLMCDRVFDALPRPIQVGDNVWWGPVPYKVLAVWGTWAWVGDDEPGVGPYSVEIRHLRAVESDRNPQ